jgi:hypothetical protein
MIIQVNDSQFLNINHIIKASVDNKILRITFITGEQTMYFNKKEIDFIVQKLKKYSDGSL